MPDSLIETLGREELGPTLERARFARKSRLWNRHRDDLRDVVELQASRWNDSEHHSFTVNVGILVPGAYETCWQKPAPRFASESDCIVRLRLGALAATTTTPGEAAGSWWDIRDAADLASIGPKVSRLLVEKALPFFDRLDSVKAVRDYMAGNPSPHSKGPMGQIYLAILDAHLGRAGEAQEALRALMLDAPAAWHERINLVCQRLESERAKGS